MRAAEEKEIGENIEAQGFIPYSLRLLEEYRASSHDRHIVSTVFFLSFNPQIYIKNESKKRTPGINKTIQNTEKGTNEVIGIWIKRCVLT